MPKEYIDREALIAEYDRVHVSAPGGARKLMVDAPAADVAPVVRCKDCKYFQPKFILTNDGEKRPYTEEEKKLPLGVNMTVGINCGSRCMRHLYWEENDIPFWFSENDFCSYGERRE